MYQAIIIIHVLLGLSVVGFVLIQQGKGADAGATFGGGSSGSVFGAQGASSFLSRTTAILATLFFATSLGIAVLSGYQEGEVDLMDTAETEEVFSDVPLVGNINNKVVPESIPVINEVPNETAIQDPQNDIAKKVEEAIVSDTIEIMPETKVVPE